MSKQNRTMHLIWIFNKVARGRFSLKGREKDCVSLVVRQQYFPEWILSWISSTPIACLEYPGYLDLKENLKYLPSDESRRISWEGCWVLPPKGDLPLTGSGNRFGFENDHHQKPKDIFPILKVKHGVGRRISCLTSLVSAFPLRGRHSGDVRLVSPPS